MKVIYDSTGAVIATDLTPIDTSKTISDTLYPMDVTVPEGKVIEHVDVSNLPHVPVFVDVPKTDFEKLESKVNESLMLLGRKDYEHDSKIKDLYYQILQINAFLKQNFNMKGSDN